MIIKRDRAGLDAKFTPNDLDIAWAAGVYEGEGSCVRSGHGKRSFSISIAQKDPEMLYRLRDFFGGTVKEYENSRGTNKNGYKPFMIFAWRVCGDRARIFLAVIYSYLTQRRQHQILSTPAGTFLQEIGPIPRQGGLPLVTLKLAEYVTRYRVENAEKRRDYLKKFHENRKVNEPGYAEKRRQNTRNWRKRKKEALDSKVVSIA
jgi:hypothetical protein